MTGVRIATRYAKSLLDLAVERGQLEAVEADMRHMHEAFVSSRELRIMLESPVVKADKKLDILERIFKSQVSELTMAFVALLTRKRREALVDDVVASFLQQLRQHKGIESAEVTSAVALDDKSRKAIHEAAEKLAGKQVELIEKVNPDVLGGFVLKVGDKQIDSSVTQRLQSIRMEFDHNPYVSEI
ncbi:MAG: ATP synthase F1 subunit delta [Flavobacteriales bacterium]